MPLSLVRKLLIVTSTVVLAAVVPDVSRAEPSEVRFRHLSLEDGLSQGAVYAILQDQQGFMWFGTEDGLNRFDGYDFEVFKHDDRDPTSLGRSFVWDIHEDADGSLWVATDGGGLDHWNRSDRIFNHYRNEPTNPTSLSHDHVRVILEDRNGILWIGTDGGGLNRFDRTTGTFTRFLHNPSNSASLSNDNVRSLVEDRDGILWVGTEGGGLNRFFRASGTFTAFRTDPNDAATISSDRVRSLFQDLEGTLWVGTYDGGLNRFHRESGSFSRFRPAGDDPTSLAADRVRDIYQDNRGVLWVATDGGLCRWNPETENFRRFVKDPLDPMSLSDDALVSIYQDRGGVLWVGTKGTGLNRWNVETGNFLHFRSESSVKSSLIAGMVTSFSTAEGGGLWIGTYDGLNYLDRDTDRYTYYVNDPDDPRSLSDNRVMSLLTDSRGHVWVGTLDSGLSRLDEDRLHFTHFQNDPEDANSLSHDGVMAMSEDREGLLWIGTYGGGVNRFDQDTETFVHYRHDASQPTTMSHDRVTTLLEDSDGVLWLGTDGGGLNRFDRAEGSFAHYRHDRTDETSLAGDVIWSLYEDPTGTFWIGTQGAGLNRWNPEDRRAHRGVFKRYTDRNGLPNNFIYGILPDDTGNLWLSTNNGLSKFDPETEKFRNYDTSYGLQSNEFNFGAHHRAADGELFFGGINGFNAFYPDRIHDNTYKPPVILSALFKLNRRVNLDVPLSEIDELVLGYRDYVVSFEFAALDYTVPEMNRYSYRLEGFDEEWVDAGTLRRATYTNLDPGQYVLRVRGSNSDGLWSDQDVALNVRVIPPPWQTWWAYSLYGLVAVALGGAYTKAQAAKLRREAEYSRKLEQEVQARTQELEQRNHQLEVANSKLEDASLTDSLTELRNRRYLMTYIQDDIALVERSYAEVDRSGNHYFGKTMDYLFLMIDLDGLKEVNDTYGHGAGDSALVQMKNLLQKACRHSDTIVRWGGDEFLVVGREADRDSAEKLAERIRSEVEQFEFPLSGDQTTRLSCSIGFAFYPFITAAPTTVRWEQVLTIADRALYVAKTSGRNAWVGVHSTDDTPAEGLMGRIGAEPDLRVLDDILELRSSISGPTRLGRINS